MNPNLAQAATIASRPAGLRIKVLRSLELLQPYEAAWNRLAFEAPQRLPNLSYAWAVSHLEHMLGPSQRWCCLLALEEDELVGVLPLVVEQHTVFGLNRPRLSALQNKPTPPADILAVAGREREVAP